MDKSREILARAICYQAQEEWHSAMHFVREEGVVTSEPKPVHWCANCRLDKIINTPQLGMFEEIAKEITG